MAAKNAINPSRNGQFVEFLERHHLTGTAEAKAVLRRLSIETPEAGLATTDGATRKMRKAMPRKRAKFRKK